MKLTLEIWSDNPILRTVCDPVGKNEFSKYKKLGQEMLKYVKNPANGGIGLAAPQIGTTKRIVVCGLPENRDDEGYQVVLMINPEIIEHSEEVEVGEEGCLSLPNIRGPVQRHMQVKVQFQDEKGKKIIRNVSGFGAKVVQHEVDHLNGVLFIDKLATK